MGFKKKISALLRNKYRFIIYNDTNYEQIWRTRLSGWLGIAVVIPIVILFVFIVFSIIAYTPVRNLIPGYPDSRTRRNIIYNTEKIDSLEKVLFTFEKYFNDIQLVVTGNSGQTAKLAEKPDTLKGIELQRYSVPPEDSIFRVGYEMEENERFSGKNKVSQFGEIYLYPPAKGRVTAEFDPKGKHFGINITTHSGTVVTATLEGTVISSNWTLNDGYVLQIQHNRNLVSIYKGNSTILKSAGEHVNAGEAVAIVGSQENKAEATLHFELWQNGSPINPKTYINF